MKHLAKLGIARETTGRNYGRIYAYDKYLKILNEGTEPLNWMSAFKTKLTGWLEYAANHLTCLRSKPIQTLWTKTNFGEISR